MTLELAEPTVVVDHGGQTGSTSAEPWSRAAALVSGGSPEYGPSATTIDGYKRAIHEIHALRVAVVLGASPALRRLLTDAEPALDEIVCIDRSAAMLDASRRALAAGKRSREIFLKADWLTMGRAVPSPLDLLIGDLALDNLWIASWPAFFEQCALTLRAGGWLVLGVGASPQAAEDDDCVATLETSGRKQPSAANPGMDLWRALERIGSIRVDPAVREVRVARFSESLQRQIRRPAKSAAAASAVERLARYEKEICDVVWSRFACRDVIDHASPWFDLRSSRGGDMGETTILSFQRRDRDSRACKPPAGS